MKLTPTINQLIEVLEPDNEYDAYQMRELTGRSKSCITKSINTMLDLGLISISAFNGICNSYKLTDQAVQIKPVKPIITEIKCPNCGRLYKFNVIVIYQRFECICGLKFGAVRTDEGVKIDNHNKI